MVEALHRIGGAPENDSLRLHLIGSDFVEAKRSLVTALTGLVHEAGRLGAKELSIALVGPNVPLAMDGTVLEQDEEVAVHGGVAQVRVRVSMESKLYHESAVRQQPATAVFLFNAGIWGYDSWAPTLIVLADAGVPVVVTSYNQFEADDDHDTIGDALATGVPTKWLWTPERNPFHSKRHRPSGIDGRTCADNDFWQCFQGQGKEQEQEQGQEQGQEPGQEQGQEPGQEPGQGQASNAEVKVEAKVEDESGPEAQTSSASSAAVQATED